MKKVQAEQHAQKNSKNLELKGKDFGNTLNRFLPK